MQTSSVPNTWDQAWRTAFERCARPYADNVAPILAALAEGAIEAAGLLTGMKALDVACGPGLATGLAKLRVGRPGSVVGIDTSTTMAGMASAAAHRTAGADRPGFAVADAVHCPFRDATFDAVLSMFGMPLTNEGSDFAEALRILRPGGTLSIVHFGPSMVEPFFDVSRLVRRFRTDNPSPFLAAYRALSEANEREFHKRRTPEHFSAFAATAGFEDVSVKTAAVRQRLWGITNFLDFCLSFPLNHLEHEEMAPAQRDLLVTVAQEELAGRMDLEEFIALAQLILLSARKPKSVG